MTTIKRITGIAIFIAMTALFATGKIPLHSYITFCTCFAAGFMLARLS
jgi:hypothetical protein